MDALRPPLLVPVENQLRELDAKLLIALVAAERGFPVILGSRATLHRRAAWLPRGIYLAKSVRPLSVRMFHIYRDLGSEIVAWDEESLVRNPNRAFWYRRRLSAEALSLVQAFFAWGPDDAELIRAYPGCSGTQIHVTGNPRADLMRPELRGYFDAEVASLRRRFGAFLLVNTNFGLVNHYVRSMSRSLPLPPGEHDAGDLEIAEGLLAHRGALFEHFRRMVASLARAHPKLTVVVRPHPVENHAPWEEIAAAHPNAHVVQEGGVLPWLLATKALIHNGCTTGVEARLLGVPAIAYQPVIAERFDNELPNSLGARAYDLDQLHARVTEALAGRGGAPDRDRKQLERHLAGLTGPLASDRIVDVLAERHPAGSRLPRPGLAQLASVWLRSEWRAANKRARALLPDNRNSADYQRHRFPGVTLDDLRERSARLAALLGRFEGVELRQRAGDVFEVRPNAAGARPVPVAGVGRRPARTASEASLALAGGAVARRRPQSPESVSG